MKRSIRLGACAAALWAAGTIPAHAALDTDTDYVLLGITYVAADSDRNADHGVGGSAGYGHALTDQLWGEARVFANALQANDSNEGTYGQAGAGLDLLFAPGRAFGGLLVLAGGGSAGVTSDSHHGSSPFANLGIGWRGRRDASAALRYRVELRAIRDSAKSGATDAVLGLLVELGPRKAAPAATPESLRIVKIEPPVIVPDADSDGIPDESDRCADTLRGAKVEPDGCVWEEQVVTLSNLRFPVNSEKLTTDIRARLDEVARFFQRQPDVVMDVYGHTDAQGSEAYNLKLSKARAASVRTYLVSKGISAQRLKSDGFGESRPIAGNDTDEGRAANRRVDLHIHARQPG